jgi:hypothetical protein
MQRKEKKITGHVHILHEHEDAWHLYLDSGRNYVWDIPFSFPSQKVLFYNGTISTCSTYISFFLKMFLHIYLISYISNKKEEYISTKEKEEEYILCFESTYII